MKTKEQVIKEIEESGMVAVVRCESIERARKVVEDCIEGGISAIELTFTVPFAHRVIEETAMRYGDKILVGAGTVLDPETARTAILSGAQFVVSPCLNTEVVKLCNRYRIACMPGVMTIREAVEALEGGADILKVFPGDLLGPAFIKDLLGPLPYAKVMPTGGVNLSTVGDWIKAGACAVGAGGALLSGDVKQNAEAFMREVRAARAAKA